MQPTGISGTKARLPRLAAEAEQRLGGDYGGVWVDGRIKLGVRAPDAAREARAREAIAQAGLDGEVDVVPTARGETEIVALQHHIERELMSVNAGADITIDAQPALDDGVVEVLTPPRPRDHTAGQAAWLEEAPDRFGASIRIMQGPGKGQLWYDRPLSSTSDGWASWPGREDVCPSRQVDVDEGQAEGLTTDEREALRRLRRERT